MSEDDEDDLAARIRALDAGGRRALLGDLESIREALGPARGDDAGIPTLREIVRDPEPGAHPGADARNADTDTDEDGLPQADLFDPRAFADRLLDETWQAEREAILAEARRGISALHAAPGVPDDAQLRARFAEAIGERVELVLGEAMDHLQVTLARVMHKELERMLDAAFTADDDANSPRDGTD